jgi:hypothetical protein
VQFERITVGRLVEPRPTRQKGTPPGLASVFGRYCDGTHFDLGDMTHMQARQALCDAIMLHDIGSSNVARITLNYKLHDESAIRVVRVEFREIPRTTAADLWAGPLILFFFVLLLLAGLGIMSWIGSLPVR